MRRLSCHLDPRATLDPVLSKAWYHMNVVPQIFPIVRQLETISIEYTEPNNPNQFRHLISPHSDAVIPWREDHQASHCTSRTRNSPCRTDNSSTRKFLDYTEVRLPELPDPPLCGPFLLSLAPPPPCCSPSPYKLEFLKALSQVLVLPGRYSFPRPSCQSTRPHNSSHAGNSHL